MLFIIMPELQMKKSASLVAQQSDLNPTDETVYGALSASIEKTPYAGEYDFNETTPENFGVVDKAQPTEDDEVEQLKKTRDMFIEILGPDIVSQGVHIVNESIRVTTLSKAFFREKDIVNMALKRAQKEMEEEDLEKQEFKTFIEWVVSITPLVSIKNTNFLTTHEMWEWENKIVKYVTEEDSYFIQPKDVVDRAIARKKGISDEQTAAVIVASLSPRRVTVIEGTAGAGKSFTMEAVKEIYMEQGYKVIGTALGWAAAKVLGESAKLEDENCKAIEGLTRGWVAARESGTDPFDGPTLVIVDEAGMVGTKHMAMILEETRRSIHPVKIVLTGDSLQVVPVAAGNALEAIIKFGVSTRINTIRRQHQFTHRRAVLRFSEQKSGTAINTFMHQECLHWCKDKDMLLNMVVQKYVSYRLAFPEKKALVITLSNQDVLELNFRIRAAYKKLGLIGSEDIRVVANNGLDVFETDFSVGDEVLLRANDKNLIVYDIDPTKSPVDEKSWKARRMGVFNRNSGRIVAMRTSKNPIGSYDFIVDLAGDSPGRVIVNSSRFKSQDMQGMPMMHNYAGTIYGSQGQTVPQVFLIDSPRMDFRLAYVGMSRHKESVDVFLDETDLHRRLDSVKGKNLSLEARLEMERDGKSINDAVVTLGRYSRTEMLQTVAKQWGKYSENLTAIIFERMRRLGEKKERDIQALSTVASETRDELLVDFLPEFNVPYPLVDIQKILKLPTPVMESQLVRPSEVEKNKKENASQIMSVNVESTPMPMPARYSPKRVDVGQLPVKETADEGYFGRALKNLLKTNKQEEEYTHRTSLSYERNDNQRSAFEDLEGLTPSNAPEQNTVVEENTESLSVLQRLNAWLNPRAKVDIPYVKTNGLCGSVVFPEYDKDIDMAQRWEGVLDPRPHYINFDGVPTVANVDGAPDPEWIAQQKEKLWTVGRFGEPRALALSPSGKILARYRFDGTCVVGEGQMPIAANRYGSASSAVYIVAGAKEWLWLIETMQKNYADRKEEIPHIIWAAKDADWGFGKNEIINSMRKSKKVVIVRSKSDDRQIPWAMDLQRNFLEKYNLQTVIAPQLPEDVSIFEKHTAPVVVQNTQVAEPESVPQPPPRKKM